jgi:hypothetical protein
MLKKMAITFILMINLGYSQESVSARIGIDAGGGGRFVNNSETRILGIDAGGGGRVAGGIEILRIERIKGTSRFELKDARTKVQAILENGRSTDMAIRLMKLKVMANFEEISEITLKDGTVLKAEEILNLK